MSAWLIDNYIELLGALLSILYLFLSIRQNILLWPIGILSAVLYMIVFFQTKFYADMGLNAYYFIISIYGWITWGNARSGKGTDLPVMRVGAARGGVLLLIVLILFLGIGTLLDNHTDSPIPYWDAFTTAGSIVATWMLTKKIIEHWILWVIIDIVSLGLYLHRGLFPTAVLFAIYTTMALLGYIQWRRSMQC
jgi:nicotinamide mononucleotide transporter